MPSVELLVWSFSIHTMLRCISYIGMTPWNEPLAPVSKLKHSKLYFQQTLAPYTVCLCLDILFFLGHFVSFPGLHYQGLLTRVPPYQVSIFSSHSWTIVVTGPSPGWRRRHQRGNALPQFPMEPNILGVVASWLGPVWPFGAFLGPQSSPCLSIVIHKV